MEGVRREIEEVIGLDAKDAVPASAKEGIGIEEILEQIVKQVPPPDGRSRRTPLKAIIFDSWYDSYRGVVMLVRVFDGTLRPKQKILLWSNRKEFEVQELGDLRALREAGAGARRGRGGHRRREREGRPRRQGRRHHHRGGPRDRRAVPGLQGREADGLLRRLPDRRRRTTTSCATRSRSSRLNDSAFTFEPETSQALGFGFRCGYLGLLHMEIVQERLEREYELSLITTAPSVVYRVTDTQGRIEEIDNPAKLPPVQRIARLEEPILTCHVHARTEDVGAILKLCQERRGVQRDLKYVGTKRVQITYEIPLAEVVFDFFDKLKTVSRGYASLDYELKGYDEADLVKLDILINGEPVDALSVIVHREHAYQRGRELCSRLREVIPKQMYEVAIQAAIGAKVIARETVKAFRKNVLAKCYGGDISRKRKLLEKQKEGKKRMKQVGSVEIPQEAFLAVLKVEE